MSLYSPLAGLTWMDITAFWVLACVCIVRVHVHVHVCLYFLSQ